MDKIPVDRPSGHVSVNKYPKPDMEALDEREKDETDDFVKGLLDQEIAAKKGKKGHKEEAPKPKGKTFAEIENEEGGPVKEALVGMAHTKRAAKRKAVEAGAIDDTDIPDDVAAFEEETEGADEDGEGGEGRDDNGGVAFEPFNLKAERERGHFDEDGNYVENKADPTEEKDAWLESDEAKVVSAAVRAKIKAQQAEAEAAARERRAPLTERQIASKKMEMAAVMQPGETVTRALKRLGGDMAAQRGKALGKREKARLAAEMQTDGGDGASASGSEASEAFQLLTGLADELLAEGEMDIYSDSKELLERTARMWLPAASEPAAKRPNLGGGASAAAAAAADDSDDDMFGDDDDKPKKEKPVAVPAAAQASADAAAGRQGGAAGVSTSGSAAAGPAAADDGVDYNSWPIKELRRFLEERRVPTSGLVEKADLVAKVKEVAAQGPAGGAADPFSAPPGYVFDPTTNYFYSEASGMYYDPATGAYGHAATGQWYKQDAATGKLVPYQ